MSKTIIITGGSRGIGAAAARLCGARGWNVAFSYQSNRDAAEETAAAVEAAGGKALVVQAEVSEEADVIRLFEEAAKAFGTLDGFVNNAGIVGKTANLVDMDVPRMRRVIEVNLVGALIGAREAIRRMAKSRGGRGGSIVNISSLAAKMGGPNIYVDYAAAKAGVDAFTIGLSREVGPEGIRVNSIRPGLIVTDIHASGGEPGRAEKLGPTTPLGRPGQPEEIGEAIVWLLSDAASYTTGAIIEVAGGR